MGKKSITSIFSRLAVAADSPVAGAGSPSPPWPWPSTCRSPPQTDSFRRGGGYEYEDPCTTAAGGGRSVTARLRKGGEMYKTVNSVYFDSAEDDECFGDVEEEEKVAEDDSFSTTTESEEWSEAVIRSLGRTFTDRFFFDSEPATNSTLAAAANGPSPSVAVDQEEEKEEEKATALSDSDDGSLPLPPEPHPDKQSQLVEESVAVAVDSEDPYRDFRASMEEMVAAHGLRDWEALEELLLWYLRVNCKHNHALIVGAFVDLLLGLTMSPSESTSTTAATTTTTTTSSSSTASTSSISTGSSSTTHNNDVTATTAATAMELCGGARDEATTCSSSSSCCAASDHDEVGHNHKLLLRN
ncbi:hypothetical protein GUJ93_ZPchr0012g20696 [Zizania palustris]|uniref:Transcription repressor n=1 Tax=Zizania palustris TaxID=103762 RepID=A0A8J5WML1_ZIZPA|nr:hypothetical protein GUJ93_ZPchr0012g20696 [Zizania palustris]